MDNQANPELSLQMCAVQGQMIVSDWLRKNPEMKVKWDVQPGWGCAIGNRPPMPKAQA